MASRACASASPGARAGRSQQLLRFAGLAGALDAMTGPGQGPGVWITGSRSIRTAISARRAASTPAHNQRRHASPRRMVLFCCRGRARSDPLRRITPSVSCWPYPSHLRLLVLTPGCSSWRLQSARGPVRLASRTVAARLAAAREIRPLGSVRCQERGSIASAACISGWSAPSANQSPNLPNRGRAVCSYHPNPGMVAITPLLPAQVLGLTNLRPFICVHSRGTPSVTHADLATFHRDHPKVLASRVTPPVNGHVYLPE